MIDLGATKDGIYSTLKCVFVSRGCYGISIMAYLKSDYKTKFIRALCLNSATLSR